MGISVFQAQAPAAAVGVAVKLCDLPPGPATIVLSADDIGAVVGTHADVVPATGAIITPSSPLVFEVARGSIEHSLYVIGRTVGGAVSAIVSTPN
jgi:hypothetical protein